MAEQVQAFSQHQRGNALFDQGQEQRQKLNQLTEFKLKNLRREQKSPSYTADWDELPVIL